MYLWLDADAWLQDWRAVKLYCAAASRGRLAITLEIDRAYKRHYKRPKFLGMTLLWKPYREAFGWRTADRLGRNPTPIAASSRCTPTRRIGRHGDG